MPDLFQRVVLPVASVEDARATCRAVTPYLNGDSDVVALHVIEKAGGAPDKAGVEQREAVADDIFEAVRASLDWPIETAVRFDTDIAEGVFTAAEEHDATAIVITPRGGSRWLRLLTGDVALSIVTNTDRPVVVLPDVTATESQEDGGEAS